MQQIPVYSFTGFLDSGKTKFIQETLEDERFNAGERTLVLVCEEGEEEYDFSTYPHQNVYLEVIDQQTITTTMPTRYSPPGVWKLPRSLTASRWSLPCSSWIPACTAWSSGPRAS